MIIGVHPQDYASAALMVWRQTLRKGWFFQGPAKADYWSVIYFEGGSDSLH